MTLGHRHTFHVKPDPKLRLNRESMIQVWGLCFVLPGNAYSKGNVNALMSPLMAGKWTGVRLVMEHQ